MKQCVILALMLPFSLSGAAKAAVVVRGTEGAPLSEARPAPDFIKPDVSIVTAQPSPSEVNPAYLGPVLLMKQAQVDLVKGTARLPLRKGRLKSGELVWFVLTDVTDENLANLHGLNYSPKLAYALTGHAAREATIDPDGTFVFDSGKVDFSPDHAVTPGAAPNFFPPKSAQPGSVGDADYTPLVHIKNASKDILFNAPMLAFNVDEAKLNTMCDGNADHKVVEDKVISICPRDGWVTLQLTLGFTFSKPILYLSTEANDPLVAALEGATYAPAMKDLPFALEDASPGESAERIYAFANGPTGLDNPQRQGLDSALVGRTRTAQHPGRHPDHQPRLQPDVAPVPGEVDGRCDRARLSFATDRRLRDRGYGEARLPDRPRRRRTQARGLHRQLPGRLPDQLTPSSLRRFATSGPPASVRKPLGTVHADLLTVSAGLRVLAIAALLRAPPGADARVAHNATR